jgi:uncharacterized phosphosugar-binding protein
MEIAGRAGGLVPTNAPSEILDPTVERDPGVAQRVLDLADPNPDDLFIIASHSGGNGSVVELAQLVAGRGHRIMAVTSVDHTRQIRSRHPSGRRLFEIADVVIDNCGVFGDAALPLPAGGAIAATSSLTGVLMTNVPGGDEHDEALLQRYGPRVRRSEP